MNCVTLCRSQWLQTSLLGCLALMLVYFSGCAHRQPQRLRFPGGECEPCSPALQRVEHPDLCDDNCSDATSLYTGPPITLSNYDQVQYSEMTLEECIHLALQNSEVLSKLGGLVVSSPQAAATLMDQAIVETDPQGSVEAALSAFDAQFSSTIGLAHSERTFNNAFLGGGVANNITNSGNFNVQVSKQTAAGTVFSVRNVTDYNRNNSPFNTVPSVWDTVNQVELRQPLLRGSGVAVNRIAGPNAVTGSYNGVLISRIRSDISLADFEATVRDLVRDVERNYWELYFAYRDLDTKITARDKTRETWQNRKLRLESGVGRPDEEAQARQQYFTFKAQAENALTGVGQAQPGVLGSERNLRRLLGLSVSENMIIKPITEPAVAPIVFDWQASQAATIEQRPEIRRQKWTIKQRELEYSAAKALNMWRLDLVGQYGFRGFGDNLFGSRSRTNGSAFDDMINGDLDDWNFGFELNGPIGNRQGHLAVRNAELRLMREKAVLREQQRQLLHDLSAAYTEVDRSMTNIRTNYNTRLAIQEELEPKRIRSEEGKDQIFFLLDVQQRAATSESQLIRSIVDYNQALLDYAYTTGGLLARYNIHLQEDQWTMEAQQNALDNAVRYRTMCTQACTDLAPISAGLDSQQAAPLNYMPNFSTDDTMAPREVAPGHNVGGIAPDASNQ